MTPEDKRCKLQQSTERYHCCYYCIYWRPYQGIVRNGGRCEQWFTRTHAVSSGCLRFEDKVSLRRPEDLKECDGCDNPPTKTLSKDTSAWCADWFVGYYCASCFSEVERLMRERTTTTPPHVENKTD